MNLKPSMIQSAKNHILESYRITGNIQAHKLRVQIQSEPAHNTFKVTNNKYDSFYIIHPSVKEPNRIQVTFFNKDVPISDIQRDNMNEIIHELAINGYTTITESR